MKITFVYDQSTMFAPAGFQPALNAAASILDSLILNPIDLYIRVGWGEVWGAPISSNDTAEGGPATTLVTSAQQKAAGVIPADATGIDGAIGFAAVAGGYNFDLANQNTGGLPGFVGLAMHEITHTMGRISGNAAFQAVDYAAPGVLNGTAPGGYFSTDGGKTLGPAFATQDASDWAIQPGDAFDISPRPNVGGVITPVDRQMMSALGYAVAPPQPPPPLVAASTHQLITFAPAILGLSASSSFIHADDGGGSHTFDTATGTDVLTGGSGQNTFFVDDRRAPAGALSSIIGFHGGDRLTVWGVTGADFAMTWANGPNGLTATFTKAGTMAAKLTLAGFTTDDLGTRLSANFGMTSDQSFMSLSTRS